MISKTSLLAAIIKEIAKEAAEAADKVDMVHQDRTTVAEPLRSRVLLNQVMKSVVTTQLRYMETVRLIVKLLVRKQASFWKKHTDYQAIEAGFLIAEPQACPPEIGPYLSIWISVQVH